MSWKIFKTIKISPWEISLFIFYGLIFTILDGLNLPYQKMAQAYGVVLVVNNILINLLLAGFSTYLASLNQQLYKQTGINSAGENLSFLAILFGMLTYGCTPCVIAFFASLGISFSVMVLPFAGLPYKFISLLLVGLGIWWLKHDLKRSGCSI